MPVPMKINASTVWEHTPLDPYKGEYPRFIRAILDRNEYEWVKLYEDGRTAKPGELPVD